MCSFAAKNLALMAALFDATAQGLDGTRLYNNHAWFTVTVRDNVIYYEKEFLYASIFWVKLFFL